MTVVGSPTEWRCNAVPPSMRKSWTERFTENLYAQPISESDSIFSKEYKTLMSMGQLIPENGKTGMELLNTKLHNMGVAYLNPLAGGEYFRQLYFVPKEQSKVVSYSIFGK